MSATPNLAIAHILPAQAQKEVTANAAFDALDQALNDQTTIDVSSGDAILAAETFQRSLLLILSGSPAAALTLTLPASRRLFVVQNACGQAVTLTTGAGGPLVLSPGQRRLLYADGANILAVAPDFASTGGGGGGGGFPAFKGALVKRTSNVAIASGTLTTLAWESAVYDTDGFAALTAQPTRLSVPAGITRVQVLCGVQWAPSSSGDRWIQILKNGLEADGLPGYLGPVDTSSRSRIALASAPLAVSAGDHFACQVWQNTSGSLDIEADPQTWFAIMALEFAAFRGALVRLNTDAPVADATDVAIPWEATVYDTDAFWSAASPTRLTVPAGVRRVRLKANLEWSSGGSGQRHLWLHKNGAPFFGMGRESDAGDAGVQNISSAVLEVAAGDHFELVAHQTSGAAKSAAASPQTWLATEVVE